MLCSLGGDYQGRRGGGEGGDSGGSHERRRNDWTGGRGRAGGERSRRSTRKRWRSRRRTNMSMRNLKSQRIGTVRKQMTMRRKRGGMEEEQEAPGLSQEASGGMA